MKWDNDKIKYYVEVESNTGYKLINISYIKGRGVDSTLELQCNKGHVYTTLFRNFLGNKNRKGRRCPECNKEHLSEMRRYDYSYVKNYIESFGYTLISDKYINNKQILLLKCPEGHFFDTNFDSFKNQNVRCSECFILKKAEELRFPFEFVKDYIESFGYTLLSTYYKNYETNLQIKCDKGHIFEATFHNFYKNNSRCPTCFIESISGENCHLWKGGVTPEIKLIRSSKEYKDWRKQVFERDNYTCQCCDKRGGKLNAHHIENFSSNKELRFDVNNGITLCESCHSVNIKWSFHNLYSQFNNTKEQLEEYIQRYKSGEFVELRKQNNT